ncbi:hypothetical protein SJI00_20840 [Pseudomonas sp. RP23018S]|uniref:hypothetical protein n=1 Tax=Pseudomonas sp. RP23018S TaxID=3096037 RepID=UPI002ACAFD33|nr:hypothetical protein [Pseudomonas sp. RP23018S]MDZ5605223.1 hypothetical protein [Pseudomonas sp. RP23018S]
MQLEQSRISVTELIDSFDSFQLCGPKHVSAVRLRGEDQQVEVLAEKADWSYIIKGRPVQDCRADNLQDLMPKSRAILYSLAEYGDEKKAYSPRMG